MILLLKFIFKLFFILNFYFKSFKTAKVYDSLYIIRLKKKPTDFNFFSMKL